MNEQAAETLDADAIDLTMRYRLAGCPAFLIRALANGNVRIAGPGIAPDLVVRMLREAANQLEAGHLLTRTAH